MLEGTIEHKASDEKGFGFIKCDEYEKNLFFHVKDLIGISFEDLQKGDKVSVSSVEESSKGFSAKGIRLIK